MDPHDLLKGLADQEILVPDAKLLGVNDRHEEIEYKDPRFNDLDEPGIGVTRNDDGIYAAYLACTPSEYAFFRFVLANVAGPEHDTDHEAIESDEAIENFWKEA